MTSNLRSNGQWSLLYEIQVMPNLFKAGAWILKSALKMFICVVMQEASTLALENG